MKIGGFAASRLASLALVLGGVGSLVWTGCSSGNGRYYCDSTGCYQCDGYGCRPVGPPTSTNGADASGTTDTGISASNDGGQAEAGTEAGSEAASEAASTSDAAPDATDASDASDASDALACSDASTCPSGTTCVASVCTACGAAGQPVCACTTSTQCTGTSQECWQNQCITCGGTNGPCPCAANTDCSAGNVCAGGVCTPSSDTCTYSSDCAAGKVCANDQCVASCPTTACPTGTTCTSGACLPSAASCTSSATCSGSTPYCVEGSCAAACSSGSCATGEYCNQGACVTDTRPQTECTTSSTCDANQLCVGGYCLYTCTTNMQCALIDARIAYCSADGYCRDQTEANPQCTQQSQCPTGQNCISNTCE